MALLMHRRYIRTWFMMLCLAIMQGCSLRFVSALASHQSTIFSTNTAAAAARRMPGSRHHHHPWVGGSNSAFSRMRGGQHHHAHTFTTRFATSTEQDKASLMKQVARNSLTITGTSMIPSKFGDSVDYWDTSNMKEFRVLFVLGGPGAGKGTQSELLEEHYPVVHLSVGELLRQEQSQPNSPHGALIEECLVSGRIVPVEISLELLEKAMKEQAMEKGTSLLYLVDGFPRNFDNLEGWVRCMSSSSSLQQSSHDAVASVWGVLVYTCPLEELERRILARAETSGRSDDNVASAQKRFATFDRETMPVVDTLKMVQQMLSTDKETPALQVVDIAGDQSVEDVWRDTQDVMNQFIAHDVWTANAQLLRAVDEQNVEAYTNLCSEEMLLGDAAAAAEHDKDDKDKKELEMMETCEGTAKVGEITNPNMEFVTGTKVVVSYDRAFDGKVIRETRVWSHQGTRGWVNIHFSRLPRA